MLQLAQQQPNLIYPEWTHSHLCHNATRANSHALPKPNAGQNHDISAQPTVLADANLLAILRSTHAISYRRIQRMRATVDVNRWAEQRPRPDADGAAIDHDGVVVDKDSFSQADVEAVVHADGRFDNWFVFQHSFVLLGVLLGWSGEGGVVLR